MRQLVLLIVAFSPVFTVAQAPPQHLVVPAAHAQNDAISHVWLPGASQDVRQVTLVGAGHLQSLVGRELTAIEYRRSAANEIYLGGTANMTVELSIAPHGPLG